MSAEHATHSKGAAGHAEHEHVHELSIWPLMIGIGAMLTYFGAVYRGWWSAIGALALLGAFAGWYYEDHVRAKRGEHLEAWNLKGKHTLWWGTIFFLCTEVMLFGGLFATYFAGRRFWTDAGTPHLPIAMTGIATLFLVASSFTYHFAHKALLKNNRGSVKAWLIGTLALGVIFLGFQVNEYMHLVETGFVLSSGMYMSTFYMLTGTHGFHVLSGLVMILILTVRVFAGDFGGKNDVAVDSVGLYWHFVDIVWIILYAIIYLQVI